MTVIDLHPDDLLEKERDQSLTTAERALLDAHLRACPACRLLRQARNDFIAESASWQPSQCGTRLMAPGLMKELEQHARSTGTQSRTQATLSGSRGRSRIGRRARYLGAALMVFGSAAAASGWWAAGRLASRRDPGGAAVAVLPRDDRPVGEPALQPAPQCVATVSEVDSAQSPLQKHAPAELVRAVATSPKPPAEPSNRAAAALFDRAMHARVAGDYAEALRLYRDLERRYPASSESRASRATVARLLLDMGQPEAALDDLGEYLAQDPAALAEEAMVDRALAYQGMGRRIEERSAWQAFLQAYPGSLHATRAQARVNELDAMARE